MTKGLIVDWISVKEAIPPEGVTVQVLLREPAIIRTSHDKMEGMRWETWIKTCVTHWRPVEWSVI